MRKGSRVIIVMGRGGRKTGYLDLKGLHENLMSAGKMCEDSGPALNHMII